MAGKAKIGAVIALDGEKEFRQSVTAVNSELRNLKSESNLVKEQFAGQANSLEALKAKHETLSKVLEAHKRKQDELQKALNHAKEDYTKVGAGLETLKKQQQDEIKKLEEMKKSGKASAEEMQKQEKVVKELADAVKRGEANYQTAENRINNWQAKLNSASAEVIKANRALNENDKYMDEAKKSTDGCAISIDEFGKKTKQSSEDIKDANKAFGDLANVIVAGGVQQKVSDVKDALLECAEAADQVGTSMAQVATLLDGDDIQVSSRISDLGDEIRQISSDTATAQNDLNKGLYQVVSAFGDSADAAKETELATKGAVAGGAQVTDAINLISAVTKAYGDSSYDAQSKVSDLAFQTVKLGQTSFPELASSMQQVTAMSNTMGMSQEELFGEYAALTGVIGSASEVSTKMRQALSELLKPSDTLQASIEGLGYSTGQEMVQAMGLQGTMEALYESVGKNTNEFGNLFSSTETTTFALSNVGDASETVKEKIAAMSEATGATERAFDKMANTSEFTKNKMLNALENLKIAVGTELNKSLDGVYKEGTKAFEWATELVEQKPWIVSAIAAITSGLGVMTVGLTAFTVVKSITPMILAFNAALAANPVGLVAVALSTATAAALAFKGSMTETVEAAEKATQEMEETKEATENLIGSVKETSDAYKQSKDSIESEYGATDILVEKLLSLNEVQGKTAGQKAEMQALVDQLSEKIPGLAGAYDSVTGSINITEEAMKDLLSASKEYTMFEYAKNSLQDFAQQVYDTEKQITDTEKKIEDARAELISVSEKKWEKPWYERSDDIKTINALQEELHTLHTRLDELQTSNEEATANLNEAEEDVKKYGDALNSVADSATGLSEAETAAGENTKVVTEEQQEAYENLRESIESTVENSISAFEKFDGGTEISTDKVIKNLDSQIEGLTKWKDNMETLSKQAGQGMSGEFYQYLEEMGPESSKLVSSLVQTLNDNPDKFREVCEKWTQSMDLSESIGKVVADGETELSGGMGDIANTAQQGAEAVNQNLKKTGDVDIYSTVKNAFKRAAIAAGQGGDEIYSNASISFYKAVQAAKDAGVQIPQSLADGIAGGQISPQEAINQINELISQSQTDGTTQAQTAGTEMANAEAQGIASGAAGISTAAEQAVIGANTVARSHQADFYSTGANLMEGMKSGINAKAGEIAQSAAQVVAAAIEAARAAGDIHSPSRKMRDLVGVQMSAGMTEGIKIGSKGAVAQAAQMCRDALEASKKELDIHSPSKKFKDEVGKQVANGFSEGIKSGNKQVLADFSKMGDGIFVNANTWLKEYKKKHTISLDDEKYYWEQVKKTAKKGSESYINAVSKLEKLNKTSVLSYNTQQKLSKMFDVSKKDSSGKKKSDADYYSEVYSAASKYLSNYKVLHNVSLKEEQKYWEQVKAKLKKGSQGYYDAQAQINSIKESIAEQKAREKQEKIDYGLSGGQLEAYKTYYKVSAKAEVDYWNTVRKKFKEGTAERLEADQKYFEAKESYNSQLEELNQEYLENTKEVNEQLAEDVQDATDAYNDALKEREDAIYSSFNLFDEFASESQKGVTLLYNLKTQVAGYADWEQQLQILNEKGILSGGLMDELKEMGPEASASIHALNELSATQLQEYENLYEQKKALSASQAEQDEADLKAETEQKIEVLKSEAQAQLNAYKTEYENASAELSAAMEKPLQTLAKNATTLGEEVSLNMIRGIKNTATKKETSAELKAVSNKITDGLSSLPADGKKLGKDTLQGILDGLTNKKKINSSAKSMVESLKKAIKEAADIHSPSRLFKKEIGMQLSAGVAEGITDNEKSVNKAGTDMIANMLQSLKEQTKNQHAVLQEYAAQTITPAGIDMVNTAINATNTNTVNVDNSGLINMLGQTIDILQAYLPNIGTEVVLDTGALVGGTAEMTGSELARLSRKMR